jgi:hypothetical protein
MLIALLAVHGVIVWTNALSRLRAEPVAVGGNHGR